MRSDRDKVLQSCESKKADYIALTDEFNQKQETYYQTDLCNLLNETQEIEELRIKEVGAQLEVYANIIESVSHNNITSNLDNFSLFFSSDGASHWSSYCLYFHFLSECPLSSPV